ncbi:MAG: FliG C-terminal domain-containing protein [Planctomycetota bacterium]
MNGIEKAAVLFRVIGAEAAEKLCGTMRPEEVSMVAAAMIRLEKQPPSQDEIKVILEEFQSMMESGGGIFANVGETLEQMFAAKFGNEGAKRLEEVRVNAQVESPFKGLSGVPFSDLERILREEHPQVQAAVLANIDSDLAAGVLGCMTEERRADVVERIATMKPPPPRLLRDMADLFIEKTSNLPRFEKIEESGSVAPSVRIAADILNAGAGEGNETMLDSIGEKSPDLVEQIRETMFTFEDLAAIDKITMQKILGGVDTKLLSLSLKACSEQATESIFAAVSQRTRDMIVEERELIGAVPLTEVQEAQKEVMQIIRGMIDNGSVSVSVGGSDGQMVE